MKDYKTIPLPELMQKHCKTDKRGLPVPYVVLVDNDGVPHFKVNDQVKSLKAIFEDRCSICGQVMSIDNRWMIGGPRSALHAQGAYIDTPVHKECGEYALQVCPYLAYSGYTAKTDIEKLQKQVSGNFLMQDPTVDQGRVPLFIFARTTGIKFNLVTKYVTPDRPFKEMEYWNNGEKLDQVTALTMLNNYSQHHYQLYGEKYI